MDFQGNGRIHFVYEYEPLLWDVNCPKSIKKRVVHMSEPNWNKPLGNKHHLLQFPQGKAHL